MAVKEREPKPAYWSVGHDYLDKRIMLMLVK